MVKKIWGFLGKEIGGLHEAAYLLAFFTFFSQILALIRDRLLAHYFGPSEILDIYYASFRIPDLIFVIITTIVSASVLIPILSEKLEDKIELKKIIDTVFTTFLLLTLIISLIFFIFTPQILKIIIPGISNPVLVDLTRILLLSPIFLGISQLFGGIVQAYKRFFIYAISPILYNIGIIVGIVYFYNIFGIYGLSFGVVLGVLLHLIIQFPFILSHKVFPKITFKIDFKIIKKVISLSLPRALALTSSQITMIVLFAISSTLAVGSITIFGFANNLQSVPLSIIGVSYSLAAFPTLAKLFSLDKRKEFLFEIANACKHIIFWSLPAIVLFIVLRAQIVRTVLGSGQFSWNDTRLTAAALALFSISILAQSLILLLVRGYYAAGITIKPVIINISASIFTVISSFTLIHLYKTEENFKFFFDSILRVSNLNGTEILILPLAFSIGMILNLIILWISFEKYFGKLEVIIKRSFFESIFASFVIGYFAYISLDIFDNFLNINTTLGIFLQGFFSGIIGLIFGAFVLIVTGNNEIKEVFKTFTKKIWKAKPVVSGQEEL